MRPHLGTDEPKDRAPTLHPNPIKASVIFAIPLHLECENVMASLNWVFCTKGTVFSSWVPALDTCYILANILLAVSFHPSPMWNEIPHTSQAPAKLTKEQNSPVGESEKEDRKASDSCNGGNRYFSPLIQGFLGGSDGKESACNAGDLGSVPGLGRSPREGNEWLNKEFSSILAWEITWIEEFGGIQPKGSDTTNTFIFPFIHVPTNVPHTWAMLGPIPQTHLLIRTEVRPLILRMGGCSLSDQTHTLPYPLECSRAERLWWRHSDTWWPSLDSSLWPQQALLPKENPCEVPAQHRGGCGCPGPQPPASRREAGYS